MAEDMTYEPVTDWRKRAQELEAWRNACPYSAALLRSYQMYKYPIYPDTCRSVFGAMADWLEQCPVQQPPAPDDDTDAPLKLATVEGDDE